jgi:hypothetical protein
MFTRDELLLITILVRPIATQNFANVDLDLAQCAGSILTTCLSLLGTNIHDWDAGRTAPDSAVINLLAATKPTLV